LDFPFFLKKEMTDRVPVKGTCVEPTLVTETLSRLLLNIKPVTHGRWQRGQERLWPTCIFIHGRKI